MKFTQRQQFISKSIYYYIFRFSFCDNINDWFIVRYVYISIYIQTSLHSQVFHQLYYQYQRLGKFDLVLKIVKCHHLFFRKSQTQITQSWDFCTPVSLSYICSTLSRARILSAVIVRHNNRNMYNNINLKLIGKQTV